MNVNELSDYATLGGPSDRNKFAVQPLELLISNAFLAGTVPHWVTM
jgi:hypothetical protein